ncbi:hypothetical protein O181_031658 [Austropuccinia psidii MF-1]|uniref:Uncharacterized protein n=1 Tax=Austropuccinia psidii MF-1 TaxID=1389203 RepID=A0A9Q3CXX5_9BASI|nr:hypothetical protein [Austropuccinia psidii MF-1]
MHFMRQAGYPCICSSTTINTCDACQQAYKKCLFVVFLFQPRGQRSSHPRHPCEDAFVVDNDETISERKRTLGAQTGQWERFWMIIPVPSSIDLSTPPRKPPSNGHFTPQPEQSDYPADKGWRWPKDIGAWANCHHVFSPMGFKRQSKFSFSSLSHFSSRNKTYFFPLLMEQNPPNPPQKDSPIPSLPRKQTLWQPTPGPSGTQWSEKFFRELSRTKEPPIPAPSLSSKPPEEVLTCEPEPEVAPKESTEERFGIYQLMADFDDSSSHFPQINQPNLVGALPLAPRDSFCGCNSSK